MPNPAGENFLRGAVATFLGLTLALSAIFWALIIVSGHVGGGRGQFVMGLMWCPALAAFLTCRIRGISVTTLGWQWAGFRFQAASYLLPAAYALIAYTLIWVTGLGSFPSQAFIDGSAKAIGIQSIPPWVATVMVVFFSATYGFIRSCASALGEEIGWRGFLVPQLMVRYGFAATSIISGCIWASWHYPILLFADYNSGTPGWYALSCFTVMVVATSVIYTWFRLRTGSVWTTVFLHASHNLFIQAIFTPITGDTGRTRYAVDEFGFVVPLVIVAFAIWFWMKRDVAVAAWNESQRAVKVPASP
jgi:membrane protease YdiL (CAAX protease family)